MNDYSCKGYGCSYKFVKWLSNAKLVSFDSLVVNTSGSFVLPVINIPGILNFLVYLVPELGLV
jgi:hypothetical protein